MGLGSKTGWLAHTNTSASCMLQRICFEKAGWARSKWSWLWRAGDGQFGCCFGCHFSYGQARICNFYYSVISQGLHPYISVRFWWPHRSASPLFTHFNSTITNSLWNSQRAPYYPTVRMNKLTYPKFWFYKLLFSVACGGPFLTNLLWIKPVVAKLLLVTASLTIFPFKYPTVLLNYPGSTTEPLWVCCRYTVWKLQY